MLAALHPQPQPTMLLSVVLPGCGSAAERSVRDREVVSSILTTPTMTAMVGSEAKTFTVAAIAANGTNDRRASKRGEAPTDN